MSKSTLEIHMLEVGGRGGVFQHSLAVCIALSEAGHRVTLHTSTDPEIVDDRVTICRCFSWYRESTRLRSIRIAAGFLLSTLPHLLSSHGAVWIQGLFKTPLTLLALILARFCKRRTLFSPHTLFTRHGGRLDQFIINRCLALAGHIVIYNEEDAVTLRSRNLPQTRLPLKMYTPIVRPETIAKWKETLHADQTSVCSVGQIRADKNLVMLVDAAFEANTPMIIIGPDTGSAADVRSRIDLRGGGTVTFMEGYFPLEDLAAVIALTGVVALPYSVASQSAVAVLAQAYGAKVLAYGVGGLTEQADVIVPTLASPDWAAALGQHAIYDESRRVPLPPPSSGMEQEQLTLLISEVHS